MCVWGDVSSLFCDVVVALYCMCVWVGGDVRSLFVLVCGCCTLLYVCGVGDVSSMFCDVVVALIVCVCVWKGMLVYCFVM